MKPIFKFMLLLVFSTMSINNFAQSADNEDEVVKIDQWNRNAYRPNEVIVHFKEDGAVQMRAPRRAKFQTTAVSAVDQLFATLGVDSIEELMPRTGTKPMPKKVRAYNGKDIEPKPLGKLYRLMLSPDKQQSVYQVIDTLKSLEEVDFAEPNYLVYTLALPYDDSIPTFDSATYVQEPLYSQQWGLEAINLPSLWNKPKRTSKRPVIAILDTGVDIEHPDLAANIWTNTIEANGIARQDDDANGFVDDIHGWDFINNHSVTNDFNGHGTHCAGIAAAVGNNGIGITGANPDALIMPVTVMQSDGSGDIATIIKGIDYATANGADVISMSFGGYSYSIAEEQALGRAYANAVLVAAVGNDGCCFEECIGCPSVPMFPAGFTFVLGVEASFDAAGNWAGFSNYDVTGPIYSTFGEEQLYNYELRAPGVNIVSTFPNGRYKNLNGTSMACPLVAGAISRLLQTKEVLSKELLFGDLIHSRPNMVGNIDLSIVYNITDKDRHPELSLVSYSIADSIDGDGDGRADAGETMEIYPIFRNAWGQANHIRYWMKAGFYNEGDWVWDDTTLVHFWQDTAYFDKPLSSYAKTTVLYPYRLTISPNCVDGRKINMTFFAICDNAPDTLRQIVTLIVENGVEIGGMITEDMTLYPNVHYIVTSNLAIPDNVTLTIKPGTVLKFKDGTGISVSHKELKTQQFEVNGEFISVRLPDFSKGGIVARGTPDSIIIFEPASDSRNNELNFGMSIDNDPYNSEPFLDYYPIMYASFCGFKNTRYNFISSTYMKDCIIKDNNCYFISGQLWLKSCNIDGNLNTQGLFQVSSFLMNTNMTNNKGGSLGVEAAVWRSQSNLFPEYDIQRDRYFIFCDTYYGPQVNSLSPNYYGSSNEKNVRKFMYDIEQNWGFSYYDLSNMLTRPSAEAHGIVWKILVDGIDAQDEFELLPPIGVGTHKCDVYFNRPMDISVKPFVSYGVRTPYTQHAINENGSWSADSTIYTAYFTIDGKTVSDGLNRLYVAEAQDDEHFEIPIENFRFNMEIAAAGSMSTGLMAEAGLGKVTLSWETDEEDFADLLGYNIYRWTNDTIRWEGHYDSNWNWIEAGWRIDTICINPSLIDASDTAFVDFDVIPGKDYYYVIRQMTTSLNSYDLSNPVVARPLTAIKGDANGSMSVDVADVITEVNYITHQNPQPFIFEAADVNSDNAINIFDVVGTINIIRHPEAQSNAVQENNALYYIENGILYVESDAVLGGVQFTFTVDSPHVFTPLDALNGFEMVSEWTNSENYLFMAYSMSGKTIGVGKNALLQIGDAELTGIALSDTQGHNVNAIPRASTALDGTVFMPNSSKYIQDGNFFIKLGDRIYNAIGTLIK